MLISLQGPLKYLQEAGILNHAGEHIAAIGKKALIVLTEGGKNRVGERLKYDMEANGCECFFCIFSGDITPAAIDRVVSLAEKEDCDVLIGVGGGRVLDTARAAADQLCKRLVIIPTTASSDAPCSAVAVIHDDNHKTIEIRSVKRNPDLVMVDTEIVANAPAYFMSAGIGDALATFYEARANYRRLEQEGGAKAGSKTALAMSRLCYDIILEYGAEAVRSVERREVTYALDEVVHAAVFLSGYGFENGGVAAAHGVNEGFSVIPRCGAVLHGTLVGFGVLVQLELENAPEEEKSALREFMHSVGLCIHLKELGLDDLTEEELHRIAKAAAEAPPIKNMPFTITEEDVYNAILAADTAK